MFKAILIYKESLMTTHNIRINFNKSPHVSLVKNENRETNKTEYSTISSITYNKETIKEANITSCTILHYKI